MPGLRHRGQVSGGVDVKAIGPSRWPGPCFVRSVAEARVKAGVLSLRRVGGFGWINRSVKTVNCVSRRTTAAARSLVGTIRKFGLDIGVTTRQEMVWGCSPTPGPERIGALAGDYVGATGEATIAVGLDGNVLVGGSNRPSAAAVIVDGPDRSQRRGRRRRSSVGARLRPLRRFHRSRVARRPHGRPLRVCPSQITR